MKPNRPSSSSNPQTSLATALSDAQSIIEAAEKRAAEIRSEAEERYLEAHEKGYHDGLRKGEAVAAETAVRLIKESSALGERLADEAARLAFAICKTAIGEHLKVEPDVVRRLAVQALRESVIGYTATLIVNPEDLPTLDRAIAELRRYAGGATVNLETDPSMSRGGCVVRTDLGEVDASIESLLEMVASHIGVGLK